jgi:hypothetical protein
MDLSAEVLGTHTAHLIRTRQTTPILQIGSDSFTRQDLSRVECFNFLAAQRLSDILNKELNVPNLRHVFQKVPPTALALPGLGAVSLAVLGAAFEVKGIGGENPLLNYVKQHAASAKQTMVTFYTLKHREQQDAQNERKAKKSRKHARRNQAHAIRVERLEAAQATAAETGS